MIPEANITVRVARLGSSLKEYVFERGVRVEAVLRDTLTDYWLCNIKANGLNTTPEQRLFEDCLLIVSPTRTPTTPQSSRGYRVPTTFINPSGCILPEENNDMSLSKMPSSPSKNTD